MAIVMADEMVDCETEREKEDNCIVTSMESSLEKLAIVMVDEMIVQLNDDCSHYRSAHWEPVEG